MADPVHFNDPTARFPTAETCKMEVSAVGNLAVGSLKWTGSNAHGAISHLEENVGNTYANVPWQDVPYRLPHLKNDILALLNLIGNQFHVKKTK